MYIKIIQHYCIMQKMSGRICDVCRTQFYPGDTIVEMCSICANVVWCVFNIYEDGSRELSSIHHTEERAQKWIEDNQELINKVNPEQDNKIVKQELHSWFVL